MIDPVDREIEFTRHGRRAGDHPACCNAESGRQGSSGLRERIGSRAPSRQNLLAVGHGGLAGRKARGRDIERRRVMPADTNPRRSQTWSEDQNEQRCKNFSFDYASLARGKAFRKWFDAQCPDIDYMRLLVLYAEGEALKRSHFSEEDRTAVVYGLLAAPDDVAEGLIRYALEDNRFFK